MNSSQGLHRILEPPPPFTVIDAKREDFMAMIVDQAGAPVARPQDLGGLTVIEALKWAVALAAVVLVSVAWAVTLAMLLWWASS